MIAVDTNVLVYAEGIGDEKRIDLASLIVTQGPRLQFVVPVQVLAELYRILVRKGGIEATDARTRVLRYEKAAGRCETTLQTLSMALQLAAEHQFQIFDAIILAASAEAGCRLLLSEDMQDGFVWRGTTIANPFAGQLHPLLADALRA